MCYFDIDVADFAVVALANGDADAMLSDRLAVQQGRLRHRRVRNDAQMRLAIQNSCRQNNAIEDIYVVYERSKTRDECAKVDRIDWTR